MAQNKSYKELMELQGQAGGGQQSTAAQSSNQMLDLILGRKPSSYNAATDPAAQAARKTAARNAKAVTQDTLGKYAGMTGGMPSTAAVSAAAQAGNAAMQQGADRVAELEQMYLQNQRYETQDMYNAFAAMQQQEQQRQQQENAEYEKKLAMAQLAAKYGDTSGLKELGIDVSNDSGGGGGSGYSGNSGGYSGNSGGGNSGGNGTGNEGLSAAVKNELTVLAYDNGGYIPADVWASYAAQYGEAALIAAGFKKAQQPDPKPGSGSSGGGHITKPIPGKNFGTIAMG